MATRLVQSATSQPGAPVRSRVPDLSVAGLGLPQDSPFFPSQGWEYVGVVVDGIDYTSPVGTGTVLNDSACPTLSNRVGILEWIACLPCRRVWLHLEPQEKEMTP